MYGTPLLRETCVPLICARCGFVRHRVGLGEIVKLLGFESGRGRDRVGGVGIASFVTEILRIGHGCLGESICLMDLYCSVRLDEREELTFGGVWFDLEGWSIDRYDRVLGFCGTGLRFFGILSRRRVWLTRGGERGYRRFSAC